MFIRVFIFKQKVPRLQTVTMIENNCILFTNKSKDCKSKSVIEIYIVPISSSKRKTFENCFNETSFFVTIRIYNF